MDHWTDPVGLFFSNFTLHSAGPLSQLEKGCEIGAKGRDARERGVGEERSEESAKRKSGNGRKGEKEERALKRDEGMWRQGSKRAPGSTSESRSRCHIWGLLV